MAFLQSDITIGRSLSLYGEFAECENRLMMELLQPGNTVIDVGTNVGTVTYWHFAIWFDRNNYRGVTENVFGNQGDINLIAVPIEKNLALKLPLIHDPAANWQQDYQAFLDR
jgi:hypothetical protein